MYLGFVLSIKVIKNRLRMHIDFFKPTSAYFGISLN